MMAFLLNEDNKFKALIEVRMKNVVCRISQML